MTDRRVAYVRKRHLKDEEDPFEQYESYSPGERMSVAWKITAVAFALAGRYVRGSRLRRDIVRVTRGAS